MMSKKYNVWLIVEEYDEETGDSVELDGPGASLASFNDYDEACQYMELVDNAARHMIATV